ncbi:MAG: hypothetical protein ACLVF5_02980, partial [Lachnospiraceae bacterium]
ERQNFLHFYCFFITHKQNVVAVSSNQNAFPLFKFIKSVFIIPKNMKSRNHIAGALAAYI